LSTLECFITVHTIIFANQVIGLEMGDTDSAAEALEKERKRKKQFKRMGKILATVWEWDENFQDRDSEVSSEAVICLTDVGQKVDQKSYRLGRHGWEDFARDLGGVYNRHIHG